MVDKAIIVYREQDQRDGEEWQEENAIPGTAFRKKHQASLALARSFLQKPEHGSPIDAWKTSSILDAATKLPGVASEFADAEASIACTMPKCVATVSLEHTVGPSPNRSNLVECIS
jgi:hypothetical protein